MKEIPSCGSRSSKVQLQRGMNTEVGVILWGAIIVTTLPRDGAQSSHTGSARPTHVPRDLRTLVSLLATACCLPACSSLPSQPVQLLRSAWTYAVSLVWGPVYALWPCWCMCGLWFRLPASLPAQPGLHSASWNSRPHPVSCPLAGSGLPPRWESSYTSSGFFLTNFPRKLLNTSESTVRVFHSPFH